MLSVCTWKDVLCDKGGSSRVHGLDALVHVRRSHESACALEPLGLHVYECCGDVGGGEGWVLFGGLEQFEELVCEDCDVFEGGVAALATDRVELGILVSDRRCCFHERMALTLCAASPIVTTRP